MKVAIVGSSKLTDNEVVAASSLVGLVISTYRGSSNKTLVSGGATGVDSIAEREAYWAGWENEIYLPENSCWEPNGYKARNLKIAENCDVLYCIRSRNSKTYGSGWTADQAERLGKPVWRYYV